MCQSNIKHLCGKCHRAVATNHRAVNCNACHFWIHIKCNNLTDTQYRKLMDDDNPWLCLKCVNEALPFSNTKDENFQCTIQGLNLDDIDHQPLDFNLGHKEKETIA